MKIICVGRNYAAHAKELGNDIPDQPVVFMKPKSALLCKAIPLFTILSLPTNCIMNANWYLRISKNGKYIQERHAANYYNAVSVGIDFTARDLQKELADKGLPWEKAKAFDNSAAVGKFIEIGRGFNKKNINFSPYKNKELVQQGNSSQMIFNFESIISHVSTFFSLNIGDLIFTGTPDPSRCPTTRDACAYCMCGASGPANCACSWRSTSAANGFFRTAAG